MTGVGNMTGTLQLIVTRKFAAVCQVELGLHELTICRYGRPHAADYRAPPAPSPLDGNVLETIESLKAQLSQLQEATMHQPYPSRERERDYMPDPYGPPPPGYAPRGYGREASPPYRSGPPPRRLSPPPWTGAIRRGIMDMIGWMGRSRERGGRVSTWTIQGTIAGQEEAEDVCRKLRVVKKGNWSI